MFRIIRSKNTSQIAMITGSKRNKFVKSENIRRETSRHFGNKKREYRKDQLDELTTNSKIKNIRELYKK
jgi:hypothetical protein